MVLLMKIRVTVGEFEVEFSDADSKEPTSVSRNPDIVLGITKTLKEEVSKMIKAKDEAEYGDG